MKKSTPTLENLESRQLLAAISIPSTTQEMLDTISTPEFIEKAVYKTVDWAACMVCAVKPVTGIAESCLWGTAFASGQKLISSTFALKKI